MRGALALLLVAGCRNPPPRGTMTDLNVVQLIGELGPSYAVNGKPTLPKDDAVRVLADFRDAGAFTQLPTGGEELWFGKTYEVHADVRSYESYLFARFKPVADGVAGFVTGLATDGWQEEGDASNIFHELQTGAPVKPSHGYKYMKSTPPDDGWSPLVKSDGTSLILTAKSPRWLRQKDNRLLIIEKLSPISPTRQAPYEAAGRYSELFRVP
jgi:hypothetical protein